MVAMVVQVVVQDKILEHSIQIMVPQLQVKVIVVVMVLLVQELQVVVEVVVLVLEDRMLILKRLVLEVTAE
jgi:hypothetical protein